MSKETHLDSVTHRAQQDADNILTGLTASALTARVSVRFFQLSNVRTSRCAQDAVSLASACDTDLRP